jgi:GNAT superfamily N-acetyltransferase
MIIYKKASKNDICPALDLALKVFMEFEAPEYEPMATVNFTKDCIENRTYTEHLLTGENLMFVALDGEIIVGMVAERDNGEILLLFVDGAYHRQGIATALLSDIVCSLKLRGFDKITLESSPYALPFYLYYGFLQTGCIQGNFYEGHPGIGKSYRDLKHSYQIALLVNAPIFDDDVFVHNFKHYDEEHGISLDGRSHIITIELSKLEQIAQKSVTEMTALERWAVFFRYTPDKDRRELVNEIIKVEERIAMAGQVLLNISKDERERARLTSEYKFAVDLESKIVEARREATRDQSITIARNLLETNLPLDQIAKVTGLTQDEIEGLHTTVV